jgi:hypothetical protein
MLILFGCSPAPTSVVERFVEAYNDENLDVMLGLCDDDFSLTLPSGDRLEGISSFRRYALYKGIMNSRLNAAELTPDRDLVRGLVVETSDWLTMAALDSLTLIYCFQTDKGRLLSMNIVLTGPSHQRWTDAIEDITEWARAKYPADLDGIMPSGQWSYSPESATTWMNLVSAYSNRVQGD